MSSVVNGDIRLLRNVGTHVPHYVTSRTFTIKISAVWLETEIA